MSESDSEKVTQERIEDLKRRLGEYAFECQELREQIAAESDSIPSLREAIADRHAIHCGPKYGQPLECCPDIICREAYKALEVLS